LRKHRVEEGDKWLENTKSVNSMEKNVGGGGPEKGEREETVDGEKWRWTEGSKLCRMENGMQVC
jgi:hypothetical protein